MLAVAHWIPVATALDPTAMILAAKVSRRHVTSARSTAPIRLTGWRDVRALTPDAR